jgi:ribonuclease HII
MPLYEFDAALRTDGIRLVAGVDEAGRGPIAGPVVAAAAVLPDDVRIDGLRDSKLISEAERISIYDKIVSLAISFGVGISDVETIDRVNILEATKLAMIQAISSLAVEPDFILVDAVRLPSVSIRQRAEVKADAKSASVAAASVIAKETRDRMMRGYDVEYPGYGFAKHKGYGTREHMDCLRDLGPCPIHRKTFGGVKNLELPF